MWMEANTLPLSLLIVFRFDGVQFDRYKRNNFPVVSADFQRITDALSKFHVIPYSF